MGLKQLALVFLSLILILASVGIPSQVQAQTATPPPEVSRLFASMTPEERVGQLFLVTFAGTDTSQQSQIYDLIANRHIGGVVLQAENDNFVAAPNTITSAYDLISNLQQIEWANSANATQSLESGQVVSPAYIPLFIGISQSGDGAPGDQILNGMTPLPSEMAIGATWKPDLADKAGTVMGQELAAMGFNFFIGPSLDVLESPNLSASSDLGSSVFGGDPYWVGQMGSAFIGGLHTGSENRLLVVATHFPGSGSSDRPNDQEFATVRKSLEQLKQIELAPFFEVTSGAPSGGSTVDALLVSHIRYQGFQGNIRATTRPVSVDAQALTTILALPEFSNWRNKGGLMVSDDLGTNAVRQFYSSGTSFSALTVARDAFVAGNDLLYLGNIVASDATDTHATVLEILDYFVQKYQTDPAFAQRVDSSVLRILTVKHRLYGNFDVNTVVPALSGLSGVGKSQDVTFQIARSAATLVSPDAQDLATLIPSPPQVRDRLVFITDTSQVKQCSTCPDQPNLSLDAFQNAVVDLYGPQSGNQTSSFRLSSYTFDDIANFMAGNSPPYFEGEMNRATWIIIALTDASRGQPQLLSRFLSERQDLLRDKRVILFSFGAPYYLDATDISHLTAYFALFSKQAPFVEVAARLLFQELTPAGASPVSIPALGYDLISITSPDPNQIISLFLDLPTALPQTNAPTPAPTPVPLFKIGDTIAIRTGAVKDHNGNPVPDGTVVHFTMSLTGEGGGILQQADAVTTAGVARISFGLDKPGLLQIRASSDPATLSEVLQLDVSSGGQPAAVTVIIPALTPQVAPPTPLVPSAAQNDFVSPNGVPRFGAWLLTMIMLLAGSALALWVGIRLVSGQWGIRWGLSSLLGGLFAYNYLALGFPGSAAFTRSNGLSGILAITVLGLLLGWGVGWWWSRKVT